MFFTEISKNSKNSKNVSSFQKFKFCLHTKKFQNFQYILYKKKIKIAFSLYLERIQKQSNQLMSITTSL
jgi:hypothetical protein